MRRSSRFFLWLLATAATTTVAYVAVNAAGSEVNDQPLTGVVAAPPSAYSTTPSPASSRVPSTTLGTTPTSTTTVATPGTTTATGAPAWQRSTLNSGGGSIIVSYRTGEVRLESVVPYAGFAYEIDDDGPTRVEVEFEAGEARYRLRAECTSAGFATDIESDED